MSKKKHAFNAANLAALGELEDAYQLYENAANLIGDGIQAQVDADKVFFDFNELNHKEI